ncbi:MAG: hypothetical protein ACOYOB_11865 [Myxococcota bacterium]
MPFSRPSEVLRRLEPETLTGALVGLGMAFGAAPIPDADIEATLVQASEVGMDAGDLRVLGVLTTWMGVHRARVNVDRLARFLRDHPSIRVRAYWCAVAQWQAKDRRFGLLAKVCPTTAVALLPVGNDFQIARRGEDERFSGTCLQVPKGALRDRPADVLDPVRLTERHAGYRNRVRMGPTWRADVWSVLEQAPGLAVADVARRAGCSFATAWQVAQDFRLWRQAGG